MKYEAKKEFLWYYIGDEIKENPVPKKWIEDGLVWDKKIKAAEDNVEKVKGDALEKVDKAKASALKEEGYVEDPVDSKEEENSEESESSDEKESSEHFKDDSLDNYLGQNALVVLKGIRDDKFSLQKWEALLEMERAGKSRAKVKESLRKKIAGIPRN